MGRERNTTKLIKISDREFNDLVISSFSAVSRLHLSHLDNVAIVVEDHPTKMQEESIGLSCNQLLFGLFEGVPKPKKSSYNVISIPDKITIFKYPILMASKNKNELKNNIRNTLWHEIGHYFGLNHAQIHALEHK